MSTITDEGVCCSFNTMPESVMFRNDVVMVCNQFALVAFDSASSFHSTFSALKVDVEEEEESRWQFWDMQHGYYKPPDPATLHDVRDMPLRALAPGLHMGLSVVLDVKEEEYYCTGHESTGFKVSTQIRYIKPLAPQFILTD